MREIKFKSYLLGTASQTDREAIDRNLVTDENEFEQLLLAEDDLIEAYLQQELSAGEQTQFEQFFLLDPERQQKLRLAQALQRYANRAFPTVQPAKASAAAAAAASATHQSAGLRRPVWQWAMLGIVLITAIVGLRTLLSPTQEPQIAQSSPPPNTSTPSVIIPTGKEVISVQLHPGVSRAFGEEKTTVLITPQIATVKVKLQLSEAASPSYEIILQPDEGPEKKLPGTYQPQKKSGEIFLLATIPAPELMTGDYRIKLVGQAPAGTENLPSYALTIAR